MEICVFTEPHRGASYETQLRFARHAEECGFAGLFRADHYHAFGASDGLPGPTDAWVTLGALARETSRLRLGTLVTSMTFRLPGPLAISVAQVDQMSNGRVELGIGAGWYEREHLAYGIPFPGPGERLDRLAEQIEIITGLWRTPIRDTFTHRGTHYQLVGAPALPKPAQVPGPPIIMGGRGTRRTPELAARYADEFNATFEAPELAAARFRRVEDACERVGRTDSGRPPLRLSTGVWVACGARQAEARRRFEKSVEAETALPPGDDPVVGTPAQVVERLGALAEIGAARCYLRLTDMTDLAHRDLIASEVLPKAAS